MTAFPRTVARRLGSIHTNHRRIATGAVRVTLFVLAAKTLVVGREVVIAARYGISGVVDAYQLSFTLVSWLPLIACSIGTSVFVPRLVGLRDREERAAFTSELHALVVVTGVGLTLLTVLIGPWVTAWFGQDLSASTQALSATMIRQLGPVALLMVLAGYHAIRLQALERHAYSFLEAAPSAGIIIFILLAPPGLGAAPLIWGIVAGATAQVVVLAWMTRVADGGPNALALTLRSPVWQTVSGPIAIMAMGQVVLAAAVPIDQYFAAGLGDGALAIMGYVNRLVGLATGVGAVILARALLPVLSDVAANGGRALGRRQALQWSCIMLAVGSGMAVLGWIMAPWGVAKFLERGAFSAEHTLAVAGVLRFGVIQLPFYFAGIALVQWFAAFGRFDLLLGACVVGIAAKISLNYLLAAPFGLAGIMAATACMYAATSLFLTLYLMGRFEEHR
jgi:peptidoglycan biosynthesis protein MviN/MurJ (putative lipid II flippase)